MHFAGFDSQPTLTGRGIQLRPLSLLDYDALFRAASDLRIWEKYPSSTRRLVLGIGAAMYDWQRLERDVCEELAA